MKTIEQMYMIKCSEPSDINEHLPTLYEFAKKVKNITEFGVRNVVSTWAFANSFPEKLLCVDIIKQPEVNDLLQICKNQNLNIEFKEANTLSINIEPTDLLFIDTWHSYIQLKNELQIHHSKVNNYIIMHDTITFCNKDQEGPGPGLCPAIKEFLNEHKEWTELCTYSNNNGLTILKKI